MKRHYLRNSTYTYLNNFYYIITGLLLTGTVFSALVLLYFPLVSFKKNITPSTAAQLIITLISLSIFIFTVIYRSHVKYKLYCPENTRTTARENPEKKEAQLDEFLEAFEKLPSECFSKADLFINLTHEMKTPLSVILGAIQLLERYPPGSDASGQKTSRNFCLMKQNCYRLLRLVKNILDISRLESGYMKLNQVNCNIVCLTEEITRSISPAAEQKNLTVEFDTETEEIITAVDIEKMERILLNLLSNAIKFTGSNGKIRVYVCKRTDFAVISVKDTGPGIPESMQAQIFERFRQVNSSLTEKSEGSGIGLAIAKAFIELQGGYISVSSREGQGSTFMVEVPLKLCRDEKIYEGNEASFDRISDAVKIELSDAYTVA